MNFEETVYVGFEFQTSVYREVADSERTAIVFPGNGFINVKYKSGNIGARLYGGGGLGVINTFVLLSGGNDWQSDFGWHVMGGVELDRFSIELQLQRPFSSDASLINHFGSEMTYAVYAGFVW